MSDVSYKVFCLIEQSSYMHQCVLFHKVTFTWTSNSEEEAENDITTACKNVTIPEWGVATARVLLCPARVFPLQWLTSWPYGDDSCTLCEVACPDPSCHSAEAYLTSWSRELI